jgi:hypothetical protein
VFRRPAGPDALSGGRLMLCRANTGGEALGKRTRQLKPLRGSDAQCATRDGITPCTRAFVGPVRGSDNWTGFADGRWLMDGERWRMPRMDGPGCSGGGDLTLLPRGVRQMKAPRPECRDCSQQRQGPASSGRCIRNTARLIRFRPWPGWVRVKLE